MLELALAAHAAPPSLDAPVRTGATSADAAVVVSIEDYAFLADVPNARADGDLMDQVLRYTVGIPGERIHRLSSANREQLLAAVRAGAADVAPSGRLWVYFAGHGAGSPDSGQPVIVGDDAKPDVDVFVARSVPVDELRAAAGDVPVLLLADACWAGVGRDGDPLVPGARFAIPSQALADPSQGLTWTAAEPSEVAASWDEAGHGWFTYLLAGAMRGWADGEISGQPDGTVTTGEADAFVTRAMATLGHRSQHPTLQGTHDVVLARGAGLEPAPDVSAWRSSGTAPVAPGPAPSVSPEVPAAPGPSVALPIAHLSGLSFADADNGTISWTDIKDLAAGDATADRALSQRGTLSAAQVGLGLVFPVFFVGGAASTGVGLAQDAGDPIDTLSVGIGVSAMAVGVAALAAQFPVGAAKKRRRDQVLEAANRQAETSR